jgi:hypothetical protein
MIAMTRQRYIRTASAACALGGAALVTKVAVLSATDGNDSALVGALYLTGFLLLTFGATWIGIRLAGDRPLPLAIGLAALCLVVPFMTYDAIIDPLAKAALGDAGPAWFEDEAGILATGVIWLAASLPAWLATTSRAPSARSAT